jgi:hypothetical protein
MRRIFKLHAAFHKAALGCFDFLLSRPARPANVLTKPTTGDCQTRRVANGRPGGIKSKHPMKKSHLIITCLASLALGLLASGCTTTKWQNENESFSRSSWGTKLEASRVNVFINTNGSRTMTIEGYKSDQVAIVEAAIKAGVEAAIAAK